MGASPSSCNGSQCASSSTCCLRAATSGQEHELPVRSLDEREPREPHELSSGLPASMPQGLPASMPLFYVEKRIDSTESASCRDGTSRTPGASTDVGTFLGERSAHSSAGTSVTRTLNLVQATGPGMLVMPPASLDKDHLKIFKDMLVRHGVSIDKWGVNGTKSVEHLFWETYEQRGCIMIDGPEVGSLKRVTRIVKIKLVADIFGVEHVLFSRLQFMNDGQTIERRQVPITKLLWKKGFSTTNADEPTLYCEACLHTEDYKSGMKRALKDRLGLTERWQEQHLEEEFHAYVHHIEDKFNSSGYPGLNTIYVIHEVTLRVMDPECQGVNCIGLPAGQEFATTEGDFNFSRLQDDDGLPIGTQLNIWTWAVDQKAPGSPKGRPQEAKSAEENDQQRLLKQVPIPKRSAQALFGVQRRFSLITTTPSKPEVELDNKEDECGAFDPKVSKDTKGSNRSSNSDKSSFFRSMSLKLSKIMSGGSKEGGSSDRLSTVKEDQKTSEAEKALGCQACPYLAVVQEGRSTDWSRVQKMAKRIADEDYSLAEFNQDLRAFPELDWYLLENDDRCDPKVLTTSSGRTMSSEYQRTIGAFFAIYWLMRLRLDGREGFSFGVDKDWKPLKAKGKDGDVFCPAEKRLKFYEESQWAYFEKLLLDAELLVKDRSELKVNEKRVMTLLALTAIHDIMKVQVLLPVVQQEHGPYNQYKTGDTIGDHDHALSYVMDFFPRFLPSFHALDEQEKKSVQFTQCQLCFNHGWLVQGEAPSGAVFTKFREALIRDHRSQMKQRDIALYFVHWLTDLAGAEPTPLGGCEKFVLKFPLPVLNSFLRSFEYVQLISEKKECEVMEEYLQMRWQEADTDSDLPKGDSAIAKMRILCMAQMNAKPILKAWDQLCTEDQEILSVEMSRTGCMGQCYSDALCPSSVNATPLGPAILVYYGPAFLQNLGNDDPVQRLSILAEVYRCARELWPETVAQVASTVTIRVDTIKTLRIGEMQSIMKSGEVWLLVKHNESEAFIERSSKKKLNKFIANHQEVQILDIPYLR